MTMLMLMFKYGTARFCGFELVLNREQRRQLTYHCTVHVLLEVLSSVFITKICSRYQSSAVAQLYGTIGYLVAIMSILSLRMDILSTYSL